MFRDPGVIAALGGADPAVRTFFQDCGFAMSVHDSGAPPGYFLQREANLRVDLVDRLSEAYAKSDLSNANWGGFEFEAFIDALGEAKRLEDESLLAPTSQFHRPQSAQPASTKRETRRNLAMVGLVAGLLLLIYAGLTAIW